MSESRLPPGGEAGRLAETKRLDCQYEAAKGEHASTPVRVSTDRRPRRVQGRRVDSAGSRSVEYSQEYSAAVDAWLDLLADLIADELLSERTSRE